MSLVISHTIVDAQNDQEVNGPGFRTKQKGGQIGLFQAKFSNFGLFNCVELNF